MKLKELIYHLQEHDGESTIYFYCDAEVFAFSAAITGRDPKETALFLIKNDETDKIEEELNEERKVYPNTLELGKLVRGRKLKKKGK